MPKAKRPPNVTLFRRAWTWVYGVAKRNPLSTVAGLLGIFGGIPAAVAGVVYLQTAIEPSWPAQRYWVRGHTEEKIGPIEEELRTRTAELDYLILKEQRKALGEAKEDLKRDPNSTSAPAVIDRLQRSIDIREKRLDESTKKK